jgi:hypothetical protein
MSYPIDTGTLAVNQLAKPRTPQVGVSARRMKQILVESTHVQRNRFGD